MEYLELGCVPTDENCAQVGQEDYRSQALKECRALINQLRRMFGQEPVMAQLKTTGSPHDFGTYYEVWCYFVPGNKPTMDYACRCEAEYPTKWDEEARKELEL